MSSETNDGNAIAELYQKFVECWNNRNAENFAALFAIHGTSIGFDGSTMNGREEIQAIVNQIFIDHQTPAYVTKIKNVRFLTPQVALVRAISGLVAPGEWDISPSLNGIHTLIAVKEEGQWRIELFQNTPAQFHGRPEAVSAFSTELRELL
jgi:uncharacterized protein (TIGR02246 family)